MTKLEDYRRKLAELKDPTQYLMKNSGLPGPRGNLELAQAFAELANAAQMEACLAIPAQDAAENTAKVFLVFCGISALGKKIAGGATSGFARLRLFASDERWRVREAVAIGLQYVGDADLPLLLKEMKKWSTGNWYEKRAAAAALAEPRLLKESPAAAQVLKIFDSITDDMASTAHGRDEAFRVLRQGMGYCWSVAVAACPLEGKTLMEKWLRSPHPDIQWVMKENLKKNRLVRMDAKWVEWCLKKLPKRA